MARWQKYGKDKDSSRSFSNRSSVGSETCAFNFISPKNRKDPSGFSRENEQRRRSFFVVDVWAPLRLQDLTFTPLTESMAAGRQGRAGDAAARIPGKVKKYSRASFCGFQR